ncbi:tripartite tricarboxylate transporter TctB family protein [Pseudoduganella namucuonensis]|uniref:Putative tricarboxylic transport membrane protein n=1 Tax=Pseudoduganella namucuonensis TaxID=1035707 RepID=A0A1I7K773_9BURK|nr:tripartite tricarboxylate transporter TctB family protein [Pseudoduganella namucuonensis]SFU93284.1 putative tricarboxylic transport membrane protein [Pseudoduganella namucuonensis]
MKTFIQDPKEFWSGAIFAAFGLAAVAIGQDYPVGTAGRMGPGYFPIALGAILGLIGLVSIARSLLRPGEALERFAFKEAALILSGVLLFGLLVRGAGLAVAIPVMVLLSARASAGFRLKSTLPLAAAATLFCVLIFVAGLGLPMPVLGSWFGG